MQRYRATSGHLSRSFLASKTLSASSLSSLPALRALTTAARTTAKKTTATAPLASYRSFSTSFAARAVAAPAVGDYHPKEGDDERVLNSPSELARKISAKVLPKLEKPDVKKVLVVGSGGLSIGQAGEFDYSGESLESLL